MMCGLTAMAMVPGRPQDICALTGTADIHGTISDELLICKICYTRFSPGNLPKLLACSHTFCEPCMYKHCQHNGDKGTKSKSKHKNDFPCPLCRKCTALPEGGVEKLSNNFTVMSLMEIIGSESSSQVGSTAGTPDVRGGGLPAGTSLMAEHCVQCDKRYPESQFPCGHCICSQCLSPGDTLTLGACSSKGTECPRCKEADTKGRTMKKSEEEEEEEAGQDHTEDSSPLSHSSPADTHNEPTTRPEVTSPGHKQGKSPTRPPPYNPLYSVDNPLYGNPSELWSTAEHIPHITSSNHKAKPLHPRSPQHQLSPCRISHPVSETQLYRRLLPHTYESPQHVETHSSCYELPGHSYESPYSLRRSQSLRRPPVPPRRHSSAPGILSHMRLRRRSISCPANNNKGSDIYQSPTELYGVAPPVPPRRRIYESPQASPVRCVKKFGRYSEVRMQTSTFRQPTKVGLSDQGDIVVVDVQQMTVQVFTMGGDYLAMFKVIGVQGASFFSPDRLAVATHRGVDIYTMAGEKLKELNSGLTVNTSPFKFGFLAATPRSVLIYRKSLVLAKEITKRRTTRPFLFRKTSHFENIKDAVMTVEKNIAVLDGAKAVIYILDEDGIARQTIDPALESCGRLRQPESITVDRSNNLYVADTGNQRVLKFSRSGAYSKCMLNCKAIAADRHLAPYGISITEQGHLVVVMSGEQTAEVRVYQMS